VSQPAAARGRRGYHSHKEGEEWGVFEQLVVRMGPDAEVAGLGRRMPRPLRWGLLGIAALVVSYLAWNALVAAGIAAYASVSSDGPADAAVVLGARVTGDEPSPVFAARIDHAIGLYEEGRASILILTGGACERGCPPEAVVARTYAMGQGVPAAAIHWEAVSRSTFGNLLEAKRLAASLGLTTLLIVTDPLHEKRAMTIAADLDLAARPAPTPTSRYRSWWSRLVFLGRETLALSSYLIARRLLRGGAAVVVCHRPRGLPFGAGVDTSM